MDVQPDFKELLGLFNDHKVQYVIVGGYALSFHGYPRFTGDIDIFVKPVIENAKLILLTLDKFGFGDIGLNEYDFTKPENVIQLGFPPVRIDLITSISGVSWDDAYASCIRGSFGDIKVNYIGKAQFVKNKKETGRIKDLADLEALGEN